MFNLVDKQIPQAQFGKDHWSLLMLAETIIVDFRGKLDIADRRMRTFQYGAAKHYLTRLKDDEVVEDPYHDDWSCLQDLSSCGILAEIEDVGDSVRIALTDYGWMVAGALRRWKAEGNRIKDFVAPDEKAK